MIKMIQKSDKPKSKSHRGYEFVDSEDAQNRILAAVDWKDRAGFEKHFTERLKQKI